MTATTLKDWLYQYNDRHQLTDIQDQLDAAQSISYGYDNNGNQISKTKGAEITNFVFDARDDMRQVQVGGSTVGQFLYDAAGLRIEKAGDRGIERYTYDDLSVLRQFDENNQTLAKFDYGPDRLLSLTGTADGTQFYLMDALNSVVNLANASGAVQARYQYDAWGNKRNEVGSSWNRFGFTGHEHDTESGLIYAKARFYDPETGRFLGQDAWEGDNQLPPSLHKYLYAYQNPTVWVDPDGNFVVEAEKFVEKAKPALQFIEKKAATHVVTVGARTASGGMNPASALLVGVTQVVTSGYDAYKAREAYIDREERRAFNEQYIADSKQAQASAEARQSFNEKYEFLHYLDSKDPISKNLQDSIQREYERRERERYKRENPGVDVRAGSAGYAGTLEPNIISEDVSAVGSSKLEYLYQHEKDGKVIYYGITSDPARRAREHMNDASKTGEIMRVVSGGYNHDVVRTLEGMELRRRLEQAFFEGVITGQEPIAEQLEKAGLENRNRGRDVYRWLDIDPEQYLIDDGATFDIKTREDGE